MCEVCCRYSEQDTGRTPILSKVGVGRKDIIKTKEKQRGGGREGETGHRDRPREKQTETERN